MSEPNELTGLAPKSVTVKVSGEDLEVTPMRVGAWAAFLVAAKPFLEGLAVSGKDIGMETLLEHPESLIAALSVATRMSKQKVESMFPDEFAELLQAVLSVNADFFTTRVKPAFTKLVDTVTKTIPGNPAGA